MQLAFWKQQWEGPTGKTHTRKRRFITFYLVLQFLPTATGTPPLRGPQFKGPHPKRITSWAHTEHILHYTHLDISMSSLTHCQLLTWPSFCLVMVMRRSSKISCLRMNECEAGSSAVCFISPWWERDNEKMHWVSGLAILFGGKGLHRGRRGDWSHDLFSGRTVVD